MLSGKKTYVVAIAMLMFNAFGWYLHANGIEGGMPQEQAIQGIMTAFGLAGLRAGVAKNGN